MVYWLEMKSLRLCWSPEGPNSGYVVEVSRTQASDSKYAIGARVRSSSAATSPNLQTCAASSLVMIAHDTQVAQWASSTGNPCCSSNQADWRAFACSSSSTVGNYTLYFDRRRRCWRSGAAEMPFAWRDSRRRRRSSASARDQAISSALRMVGCRYRYTCPRSRVLDPTPSHHALARGAEPAGWSRQWKRRMAHRSRERIASRSLAG